MKQESGLSTTMPHAIASAIAFGAMITPAISQEITLIGHRVHQMVTTEGAAGAPANEWAA